MHVSMAPREPLSDLVDSIWLHDVPMPTGGVERRLPTGRAELMINLRADRFSLGDGLSEQDCYPGVLVAGPFARPYVLETAQQSAVLGVVFKPGVARPLLGVPQHELADRHVALADLWGNGAAELRERALAVTGPRERLAEVERVLWHRLTGTADITHPAAVDAIAWMSRAPAYRGVAQLADRLGWTPRRVQQVFRAEVGLTPRAYQRLNRFRSALAGINAADEVGWSAFARQHGYCDQSHLIREFHAHAGVSPSAYLRLRGPARNHLPVA